MNLGLGDKYWEVVGAVLVGKRKLDVELTEFENDLIQRIKIKLRFQPSLLQGKQTQ